MGKQLLYSDHSLNLFTTFNRCCILSLSVPHTPSRNNPADVIRVIYLYVKVSLTYYVQLTAEH